MALSVKTREHIRRWAALAGPKWGALLGGAAALAAAITFTGSALHFTTVADTHGDTVRILTAATDLAAVLQQSGKPSGPRPRTGSGWTSCAPTRCRSRRTAQCRS